MGKRAVESGPGLYSTYMRPCSTFYTLWDKDVGLEVNEVHYKVLCYVVTIVSVFVLVLVLVFVLVLLALACSLQHAS